MTGILDCNNVKYSCKQYSLNGVLTLQLFTMPSERSLNFLAFLSPLRDAPFESHPLSLLYHVLHKTPQPPVSSKQVFHRPRRRRRPGRVLV